MGLIEGKILEVIQPHGNVLTITDDSLDREDLMCLCSMAGLSEFPCEKLWPQ